LASRAWEGGRPIASEPEDLPTLLPPGSTGNRGLATKGRTAIEEQDQMRSPVDRLAPWATTGVGSVPFADPRRAAAHAVAAYDVPFCPQLLALEGDMLTEWLGGDPQRCGWSADRDRRLPLAWTELLDALAANPPEHGLVKLQVTGPLTLASALERRGAGPTVALARELAVWLAANAAEWVAALRERELASLLVIDEPSLHAVGKRGVDEAWEPLRAIAPAWGLHVCCAVPWDLVRHVAPDVLSFDLAAQPLDRRAADALTGLLDRGGRIAWGVLAAHRAEGATHALARLDAVAERLAVPGAQSLLTAGCGTGRLSIRRELDVAAALAATKTVMAPVRR
jgi:hypothetical protein